MIARDAPTRTRAPFVNEDTGTSLDMHNAATYRDVDRRGPLIYFELGKDVLDVHRNGRFSNAQFGRDNSIALPSIDQLNHLDLTRRQRGLGGPGVELRFDVVAERVLTCVNIPH